MTVEQANKAAAIQEAYDFFKSNTLPNSQEGAGFCLTELQLHLSSCPANSLTAAGIRKRFTGILPRKNEMFLCLISPDPARYSAMFRETADPIVILINAGGAMNVLSLGIEDMEDLRKFKALCRDNMYLDGRKISVDLTKKSEISTKLKQVWEIALRKKLSLSCQNIERIAAHAEAQGWEDVSDWAYALLANFYFSKGQYEQGLPYAEKIKTADNLSPEEALNIGNYYASKNGAADTLKGLRFLYRAASSTEKFGLIAREMLQLKVSPHLRDLVPLSKEAQISAQQHVMAASGGLDEAEEDADEKKDEAPSVPADLFFASIQAEYDSKIATLEARVPWDNIFKKSSALSELMNEMGTFIKKEIESTVEKSGTLQGKIWQESGAETALSLQWFRIQQSYKALQIHKDVIIVAGRKQRAIPIDQYPIRVAELILAVNAMKEQLEQALRTHKGPLTSFWTLRKDASKFHEKALAFCSRLQILSEALEMSVQHLVLPEKWEKVCDAVRSPEVEEMKDEGVAATSLSSSSAAASSAPAVTPFWSATDPARLRSSSLDSGAPNSAAPARPRALSH